VVTQGNHDALGPSLTLVREWLPFDILHFPIRSAEQAGRKFRVARTAGLASPGTSVPQHTEAAVRSMDAEGEESFYGRLVVDDVALERGLATGEMHVDTRLRDALRDGLPAWEPPVLGEDVALAVEAQAMLEHDAAMKLAARAERLERRLGAMERSLVVRRGIVWRARSA